MADRERRTEWKSIGRLHIDLDALVDNYRLLGETAGSRPGAMVKADGYGVGLEPVVDRLLIEGCRRFFVARLSEAVRATEVIAARLPDCEPSSTPQVFILDGVGVDTERQTAAIGAIPVLNSLEQIGRWQTTAKQLGRQLPAALHVDTGMHRLGLPADDWKVLHAERHRLDGLVVVHVMSHLACADDDAVAVLKGLEPTSAIEQLQRFEPVRRAFPNSTASLANSAGIFCGKAFHLDTTRPGIALYGGSPWGTAADNPMRSVVTASVPILQVQTVHAGESVGYGRSWRATETTRVATIAVGYADGYPRSLSNNGSVSITQTGSRAPIVGRISMDLTTIDVGHLGVEAVVPGGEVELFGPSIPLDEVAERAGTIGYELLTSLGRRYERNYAGNSGT